MSIRKQILQPQTLRHFKLPGNPFDEVASSDEFYANEQLRYTRAQLLDACKRGGFVAVVGESGSARPRCVATCRSACSARHAHPDHPPYVVGMEADDTKERRSRPARSWTRSWPPSPRMNRCARAVTHGTASWRTA